jgi:hypothetical protein
LRVLFIDNDPPSLETTDIGWKDDLFFRAVTALPVRWAQRETDL